MTDHARIPGLHRSRTVALFDLAEAAIEMASRPAWAMFAPPLAEIQGFAELKDLTSRAEITSVVLMRASGVTWRRLAGDDPDSPSAQALHRRLSGPAALAAEITASTLDIEVSCARLSKALALAGTTRDAQLATMLLRRIERDRLWTKGAGPYREFWGPLQGPN